ncbi:S-adenosyl-L-methionine-dependent methyltransferase-like [Lasallia pustulata]|uniref:S-adenosyl-L-methionine-dependent methyltransferase-like n=1 Tax=Lasallia pustulata TaxID=136370 RepID=A0A1W5CXP3_9LECA|nr:S-adenosyl-L-methionine-dependent methyltransferase-like [Lasallia pustulata]
MNSIPPQSSSGGSEATTSAEARSANATVKSFLLQNEPAFRRLEELREKGWSNPKGDEYFEKQRSRADNARGGQEYMFFRMMQGIGDELQASTDALTVTSERGEVVKILDICMAPGGYTASALKYNPAAIACGVTLPLAKGGHKLLLPSSQYSVEFLDITMLASEFGVDEVPSAHPEHDSFSSERPYLGQTFHLVFCDGQVLRTHQRAEHREQHEALRLTVSQLIFALQRIRPGGTLVMLLHKIEAWDTTELLCTFSRFSSLQLFKPEKKHAIRSSFYLVAKNVQPNGDAAKQAVEVWKQAWWRATFGGQNGAGEAKVIPDEGNVQTVLDEFGKALVMLGRPIWDVQANALRKTDFVK